MARAIEVPVVAKKGTLARSIEGEAATAFRNLGRSSGAVAPLGRMLGKIRADADEFTKSIEASNARVIAFGASVGVINGISNAFKELVRVTVSVEKSLTDINVVLNANQSQLTKFGDGLFKVAKNTAQSFDVVAEAATEFARQGLSIEETLRRTNDALVLTRLTGIKAADAVKGLTAATNGFAKAGLTTTEIINKLAAVDVKFAVSADGLVEALKRTGAVAMDAGLSFDELIGMVTAAQQTTARGEAVIGNAFKTIFTRVQRPETLKTLRQLKIAVEDASGQALSARQVLENLARSYDGLSASAKDAVNQQVAGVFQINILKAAVGDLQKQNSIAARATAVSASATDEAAKKNEMLNQTIAALTSQTGLALTELAKKIGDIALAPGMRDLVGSFKALVEGTTGVLDGEGTGSNFARGLLKGIGNVLTGPGLIVIGGVFIKLFKDLTVFGMNSLKNLLGLNNAAKQQAALQQGIGTLLQTNTVYQTQMAAAAGNVNKQAAITQRFLQQEIAMRQQAAALTSGMAGAAFMGGFRVDKGGDIVKKRRGLRGMVPGLAPTEVPNFGFRAFNPRVTKAGGTGPGSSPFQFTSASMLGTSENYRGTFNLNASKAALAKELPAGLADIVKNSTMSGFQMQTKMAGFSPKQQEEMIGQMKNAVSSVPGLSDRAKEALIKAHSEKTSLLEVNAGISAALKKGNISKKDRGAYDQHMGEVTEKYFNKTFGTVGTGGRQGADYAIDAIRYRRGRTDPMELKKLAGFTTGDATTIASAIKKQLVSGTNPALRNRLREEARMQGKSEKFEQAMLERFAQEYRAYVINNPGGLRGRGTFGKESYFTGLSRDQVKKGNLANLSPEQKQHIQDEVLRYNRQVLNFAPIGDAIKREKHQVGGLLGINPSQVKTKVIQNTALRSSFNPGGFGVISPTIGQNSFADAARMHKGEDLRTANLPNFAKIRKSRKAAGDAEIEDLVDMIMGTGKITPTGYTSGPLEVSVKSISDEPAKKLGRETARELPKAMETGLKAKDMLKTTEDIKAQKELEKQAKAAARPGVGGTAMNAFMAYSLGTMLDPVGQQFGARQGDLTAGLTGGYLGAVGGSALTRALGAGARGARFGGGIGALLAAGGSVIGSRVMSEDAEFLREQEGTSILDQIMEEGMNLNLPALIFREQTGAKTMDERAEEKRELFRSQINKQSLATLARLRADKETSLTDSRQESKDELTERLQLTRERQSGLMTNLQMVSAENQAAKRARLTDTSRKLEDFRIGQSAGIIKDLDAIPFMQKGGIDEIKFRNVIRTNLEAGNFQQVASMFEQIQSGGNIFGGAARGGMPFKKLSEAAEKFRPGSVLAGTEGMAASTKESTEETEKNFRTLLQANTKLTSSIFDLSEAHKELESSLQYESEVLEITNRFRMLNAEMKNVDQVAKSFKASLTDSLIGVSTGTQSASDAFRNMGINILGEINRINNAFIASEITTAIFGKSGIQNLVKAITPQGTSGRVSTLGLQDPGKQSGGIIKAQNGMYISGNRTGDKNPALLEDGEYVLNKKMVDQVGVENLNAMNFDMFPRFGGAKSNVMMAQSGGFMSGLGSILMAPFNLIGSLFQGIFGGGGGGGRKRGTAMSGTGTSMQSKRAAATDRGLAETNKMLAQLDAISNRGGAAGSIPPDSAMVSGIRKRAAHSKLLKRIKDYSGINPGAVGLEGVYSQDKSGVFSFGGGRPSPMSGTAIADVFNDSLGIARNKGAGAGLVYLEQFYRTNPRAFDRLSGFPHGQNFSQKEGFFMDLFRSAGVTEFASGGRLASPISRSGVKSSALESIIKDNEFLPPVAGMGSALGGGGASVRLGITDPRLSGFAHANDPILQNVRSDIQSYHEKQRQKKFEKQSKKDALIQQIVGAGIGAAVAGGIGGLKGLAAKDPSGEGGVEGGMGFGSQVTGFQKFARGARGLNPYTLKPFQRGGHIDNIPAMLTGGEFVVNPSTVRRHGSAFFSKLNRGGRVGYQTGGIVGDQQFVPAQGDTQNNNQTETSNNNATSNTTVNITVNTGTGETNVDGGNAGTEDREMATRLRDAVLSVLKQEKRTGGMLRDVTSNDQ